MSFEEFCSDFELKLSFRLVPEVRIRRDLIMDGIVIRLRDWNYFLSYDLLRTYFSNLYKPRVCDLDRMVEYTVKTIKEEYCKMLFKEDEY